MVIINYYLYYSKINNKNYPQMLKDIIVVILITMTKQETTNNSKIVARHYCSKIDNYDFNN